MTFLAKARSYSLDLFTEQFNSLEFSNATWNPTMMVLHHTDTPTLTRWLDRSTTPAERTVNLRNYYRNILGWHSGPHWLVAPEGIWEFCDPLEDGVHCSCCNHVSFGCTMVGNFDKEAFNQGPGALVRDNAVHLMATVFNKMGWQPDPLVLWDKGLAFHSECEHDRISCPGKNVDRDDIVQRVTKKMSELKVGVGV